jgi:hypothetical protein
MTIKNFVQKTLRVSLEKEGRAGAMPNGLAKHEVNPTALAA